jgi:dienelactone hydrolase
MSAPRLQPMPPAQHPRRTSRWLIALILVVTIVACVWYPVYAHLRAVAVLLRIQSAQAHGFIAGIGIHPITTEDSTFASDTRRLRTRLYLPTDLKRAPAMVIVHGVHHLGYDEPRMVRFAKAMAGSGLVVATPELPEIAGYEITPVSIGEIAAAADDLAARMNTPCVGVLGLSFAGGLALEAASDPATSQHICYVVAVGAHDDMARVMKFFATDQAVYPDGHSEPMVSHEYGALVAIYSHLDEYFPAKDVPAAREAVRAQLFEETPKSREIAMVMSPQGQATMKMLLSNDLVATKAILLANLEKHRAEMDAVSPASQLYRIHVPVMLLHGAGDNVVPPSETLWLAKDIPAQYLRGVLVSRVISHVELGGNATLTEKLKLVHFVEQMLAMAQDGPRNAVELRIGD